MLLLYGQFAVQGKYVLVKHGAGEDCSTETFKSVEVYIS